MKKITIISIILFVFASIAIAGPPHSKTIFPINLSATNSLTDNYVPSYDLTTKKFTWVIVYNQESDVTQHSSAILAAGSEGDLADSIVVSADIKDGEITNSDINASASIAQSKLATLVGANETFGIGWNGDTGIPEKDDIWDWAAVFDSDGDGLFDFIGLEKLTSVPGSPVAGRPYYADGVTWDPAGLSIGKAYYVIYDGASYIALWDEDGTLHLSNTPLDVGTDPDVSASNYISLDSDDFWLRLFVNSEQRAVPTEFPITLSVAEPDTMDARDYMPFFTNNTGASITIISMYCMADDDDTDFRIEEYDADGSSNEALVKAETCDTGSGPYTNDAQTTITNATVEDGHILVLDFDDTDTPDYLHCTIWYTVGGDVD